MKKLLIIPLLFLASLSFGKDSPTFTDSPKYNGIKYYINEYTGQRDGTLATTLSTSSDSLRLGGQLPSYYAQQTVMNSVILSTGYLQTQVNTNLLTVGTTYNALNASKLSVSSGTIFESSINSIILSTGYLQTQITSINNSSGSFVVTSTNTKISTISGSLTSLKDYMDNVQSGGRISGGAITAHSPANGQVDISAMTFMVKTGDASGAETVFGVINSTTITMATNNDLNYVYLDYNGGTPRYLTTNDRTTVSLYNQFICGRVYREGTDASEISITGVNIYNEYRRIHERLLAKWGIEHISGAVVSESGTRGIATTQGLWYIGNSGYTTPAKILSNGFDLYRTSNTAGTWYLTKDVTQVPNTTYDLGNGSTDTLSNNRYAVFWVYICVQGDRYIVYGQGNYTLSAAQSAQPLAVLPNYVYKNTSLSAKIIIAKSGTNFTEIDSAWNIVFVPQTANNHNELGNLTLTTANHPYDTVGGFASYDNLNASTNSIVSNINTFKVSPSTGILPGTMPNTIYASAISTGSYYNDVSVSTALWSNSADHTKLTNIGTITHPQIEGRIGNLESLLLQYSNIYSVSLNFSSGTAVDVDTTTYSSALTTLPTKVMFSQLTGGSTAYLRGRSNPTFSSSTFQGFYLPKNTIANTVGIGWGQNYTPGWAATAYMGLSSVKTSNNNLASSAQLTIPYTSYPSLGNPLTDKTHGSFNASLTANITYYVCIAGIDAPTGGNFLAFRSAVSPGVGSVGYAESGPYANTTWGFYLNCYVSGVYKHSSYSQVLSTTTVNVFRNWGKINIDDYQPSGSSITYRIQLSSSNDNWASMPYETVINNQILSYTSSYINTSIEFTQTISTAIPKVNSFIYTINYSPPLYTGDMILASTQTVTGTKTYTGTALTFKGTKIAAYCSNPNLSFGGAGTWVKIVFDSTTSGGYDTLGEWNKTTSTFTATQVGTYTVSLSLVYSFDAADRVSYRILKNGVQLAVTTHELISGSLSDSGWGLYAETQLVAGDAIHFEIKQWIGYGHIIGRYGNTMCFIHRIP